MVLYIDTQDIDQYPGTIKRVAIDQEQIVPTGYDGDEQFLITVGTTAYSDNVARTVIQDQYITDFVAGWAKSSGFAGTGGGFELDSTHYTLKVKMDATVSGSDGSGYYTIMLDWNMDESAVAGEIVAADMEAKIRAIDCVDADAGHQLAYTNAVVEYKNGKFWVISGSIARHYSGANRSSVKVVAGDTNDASSVLGFDLLVDSESISTQTVPEALVKEDYTADTATLNIAAGTGVQTGDAMLVSDGTNIDYFIALGVAGGAVAGTTDVTVPVSGTNGFVGIANSYTKDVSKVQILREQDPDPKPNTYFQNVDELIRFGIKNTVNQIDYSS